MSAADLVFGAVGAIADNLHRDHLRDGFSPWPM
jgi:hypothetical protein